MGVEAVGETPSLTGEVVGETHGGLEHAQAHPTWEAAQEGPNLIVGSGVKDQNPVESGVGALAPSRPLPHIQCQRNGLPHPGQYLRLHPLESNRYAKTKKI